MNRKCIHPLWRLPARLLLTAALIAAVGAAVAEDGSRFVALAHGVVADRQTGLEWIAGPDEDTSYDQAARWVRTLTVAGGGWRMPTASEINTLCRTPGDLSGITPLLNTRATHIWPHQDDEDLSLYLFRYMDPYGTRGFAVRSSRRTRTAVMAQ